MELTKKNVAVLGLGIEGRDLVNFLLSKNANVTVLDKKQKGEIDLEGIDESQIKFECGEDYLKNLKNFEIIFRSPGVYRYLPEIIEAEKNGVEISSALKLFLELCPGKVVGVTGTKGKGTTSSLIYQILINAKCDVYLAGNIGTPYLELLQKLKKYSVVVLEMSSFQLIDANKSPNISVILNITSDHMDWHKDVQEYIKAKENIVKFQKSSDFAVINSDYEVSKSFGNKTKASVYNFSRLTQIKNGAFVEKDQIFFENKDHKFNFGKKFGLLLRGDHNLENICAAICVAEILKVKDEVIQDTIFSFKGLEHRLELVDRVGGVAFYNDSFATGPQPTIAAIQAFIEPLTVILGGSEKFLDYAGLGKAISKSKNVKNVVLIGDVAQKIETALVSNKYKGNFIRLNKSPMQDIVKESFKNTPKGGIVLLSPAAASFDMFKNYKDRGMQFKEAIKNLH